MPTPEAAHSGVIFKVLDNHSCRSSKDALCRAPARSGVHASLHRKARSQNLQHPRNRNQQHRREASQEEDVVEVAAVAEETLEVDQRAVRAVRAAQETSNHTSRMDEILKMAQRSFGRLLRLRGAAISLVL